MSRVETTGIVDKLEKDLQLKKSAWMARLAQIIEKRGAGTLSPNDVLDLQKLGADYFNEAENIVGKSALLEADHNGDWVLNFAESCHEILETLIEHKITLDSSALELGMSIQPAGKFSYSAMQRVVSKYLPESDWQRLKREMETVGLPTSGFGSKATRDKVPAGALLYIATAAVGIIVILITSFFIPEPSRFQTYVFKAIFSISLGALGSFVPGFLGIDIKYKSVGTRLAISAGGALAIFIVLLGYNPS